MARTLSVQSFSGTITSTGVPQKLLPTGLLSNKFTDGFRVASDAGNSANLAIGGSDITVGADAVTDGEPIIPGANNGLEITIDVRVSSTDSELDMSTVWIVGTEGDIYHVTYIAKVN